MQLIPHASSDDQLIKMFLFGRSTETRNAYARDISRLRVYVQKPLREVTLADLQAFVASLNMAPSSINRAMAAVKSLWAFGTRIRYFQTDIGAVLKLPKIENHLAERILTEEQIDALLSQVNGRNALLIETLYRTGMRVSELCALKWRNVTEGGIVVKGKGGKTRVVPVGKALYNKLMAIKGEPDTPVFPSRYKKGHLSRSQVERIVSKAAKTAGLYTGVSPHWLRHSCATHAIHRQAPLHLVQQQLGHATLRTTGMYLHARPGDCLDNYLKKTSNG